MPAFDGTGPQGEGSKTGLGLGFCKDNPQTDLRLLWPEFVKGGLANEKGLTEDKADPKQLEMGIKVEMEHTTSPEIAKRIALDHLAEFPNYYTALAEMENKLKAQLAQTEKGAEDVVQGRGVATPVIEDVEAEGKLESAMGLKEFQSIFGIHK